MRVHELAKEIGVGNREIIEKLNELGASVTNHMSSIDESQARKVREAFGLGVQKETDDVSVKRMSSTVVRRRKVVRQKGGPVESAPGQDEDATAEASSTQDEASQVEAPVEAEAQVVPAEEAPAVSEPEQEPASESEDEDVKPSRRKVVSSVRRPQVIKAAPSQDQPKADAEDAPADDVEAEATVAKSKDEPTPPPERRDKDAVIKGSVPASQLQAVMRRSAGAQPAGRRPGGDNDDSEVNQKRRRVVTKRKYKHVMDDGSKSHRSNRNKRGKSSTPPQSTTVPIKESKRKIRIEEMITVGELAKALSVKAPEIIKKFIGLGMMVTLNEAVDADSAAVVASDYGFEVEKVGFDEADVLSEVDDEEVEGERVERPPVVTVMGHVDHGKTSLLDAIREANVVDGEAGGITQHIGSYQVEKNGKLISFIDTPGHEAFTAMRARGAEATDIVILVVAANDGVMPQTVEAIKHAQAAGVPIVVAVNKMDLHEANPDNTMREVSEHGLLPEDWGGDTQFVRVSAKTQEGIPELLEAVLLQAEVLELKAIEDRKAIAIVLESRVEKGRGVVVNAIVKDGTLNHGEIIVGGAAYARIRAMTDDQGHRIKVAGPSKPVEILGFNEVPDAGALLHVVESEKQAKQLTDHRREKIRQAQQQSQRVTLEDVYAKIQSGETATLNMLIKADVHGSAEALIDSLQKLSTEDYQVNVINSGVGAITENDINLAAASNAMVLGFNTRPDSKASNAAASLGVEIRVYSIIYKALEEIEAAMLGMLEPETREESLGWLKVKDTFTIKNTGTIAGCEVISGKIQRGQHVRLVRDGQVTYSGKVDNLRRFKDDVKEVTAGLECGVLLEHYNDVKIGDELECYIVHEIERKPSSSS